MEPDKKVLTPARKVSDTPRIVGELRLTLTEDEMLNVEVVKLGRLTPGRLERAQHFLYTVLMRARAAEETGQKMPVFQFSVSSAG